MKKRILIIVILICSISSVFANRIKYKQYALGIKLYLKGDYNSAVKEFQRLINFSDVRSDSFLRNSSDFMVGMAFYESKKYASALEFFRRVRDNYKGNKVSVVANYWYAATLQNLGRLRAALYYYNLFLKKYSDHSLADDALYGIGMVYFRAERFEKAREKFQAVLDYYPKSGKADAAEAMVMFIRIMDSRLRGLQINGKSTYLPLISSEAKKKLNEQRLKLKKIEDKLNSLKQVLQTKETKLKALELSLNTREKALLKKEKELNKSANN